MAECDHAGVERLHAERSQTPALDDVRRNIARFADEHGIVEPRVSMHRPEPEAGRADEPEGVPRR